MAITRLKYVTTNLAQAITPTVTGSWGADASYPIANITNYRVSKRAGFDTAKDGELVFNLGSAKAVSAVFLFNHNLSSGVTAKFQGHASDSWGTPTVDETITYAANDMLKEFTADTLQYWRLTISDAGRAASDIKIGEIVFASPVVLTRNFDWNLTERSNYNNIDHLTAGGNRWVYARYSAKNWVMTFAELLAAQNTLLKNIISNSTGNLYPFSIILESTPYYVRALPVYETTRPFPIGDIESGFTTDYPLEYGVSGFELAEESRGIS